MKPSVCVDALYNGKDFITSMEQVNQLKFSAVEFWCWWDKDIQAIKQAKERLKMEIAGFCTRFISLVDASQRPAYLQALEETIRVAKELGSKMIITQVGNDLGIPRAEQKQSLIDGLKACVPMLEKHQMMLVFEPLNTLVDHAGYFLSSSDEAFQIAQAVASPHVKVLFDVYHQQIMEGNIISRITEHIDEIGHFHFAGVPGRSELYHGELNYPEIIKAIRATSYEGFLGLEYFPKSDPSVGLERLAADM
jgi:hydroxypyruvate isomerase